MFELRRVCVFCGSRFGERPAYRQVAEDLGHLLAAEGLGLVYGGGAVGLMGATADAAMAAGGEVIGVIPSGLFSREVAHTGLTELHRVPDMHTRKALMYDLSDAFCVLPGGLGTLEELFESATWNQLGLHGRLKPLVLVDCEGYWGPIVSLLDRSVADGFVKPHWRDTIMAAESPAEAIALLRSFTPHDESPVLGDDPPAT